MFRPPLARRAGGRRAGRAAERRLVRAAQGGSSRGARGALQAALAGRLPRRLLHRPRRGRRRGHRPGGVPRRGPRARPLRRAGARSRPGSTGSWSTARSTIARARALRREVGAELAEPAEAPEPEPADLRRPARRAGRARRPSSARSWCCATCSTGRPARSRGRSAIPRGTVNSRLRRALDRLAARAGGGRMTERELQARAARAARARASTRRAERTLRVLRAAHAAAPRLRRPAGAALLRPALALLLALAALGHGAQPGGRRRAPLDRRPARPGALPHARRALPAGRAAARELARGHLGGASGRRRFGGWATTRAPAGRRAGLFVGRRARAGASTPSSPTAPCAGRSSRPAAVASPPGRRATAIRVAYLEGARLRVVAGNGRGDRLVAPAVGARDAGLAAGSRATS